MTGTNGNGNGAKIGTDKVKQGLAQMLKGGVISVFKKSDAMNCFSALHDSMNGTRCVHCKEKTEHL
eukprot:scaffold3877_cov94-Skeletonema_dohrnii-CCMP3373.AAC.4